MTKKPKTLAEAAASILEGAKDIFDAERDLKHGEAEHRGVGKGEIKPVPGQTGPGEKPAIAGPVIDPAKSGIEAAKNAGPNATPPGKVTSARDEQSERKNIKSGEGPGGKKRAKVDDSGVVTEQDIDEEDMDEGAKTDTTHEIESLEANDGTPDNTNAHPVSAKVKAYFKGKSAGLAVEDINAIFAGQELSEDFKSRAKVVYEAAVINAATVVCEGIEAEYATQLVTVTESLKDEMASKLDEYVTHMTEEWMKDNQLSIGRSLKTEIAESFMKGLQSLFTEHFIDIPDDKVDIVEEFAEKVDVLEGKLDESIKTIIELKKQITEGEKAKVLATVVEGMTDVDATKIKTLAEGVEFSTASEFTSKVTTLKESYFPKAGAKPASADSLNEDAAVESKDSEPKEIIAEEKTAPAADPRVATYVKALKNLSPV